MKLHFFSNFRALCIDRIASVNLVCYKLFNNPSFNYIFSAPLVRKLIATYRSRYNRLEEDEEENDETTEIVEEPQHVET